MSVPVTLYTNTSLMLQHEPPRGCNVEEPARLVGIEAHLKGHPVLSTVHAWRTVGLQEIPVCKGSLWDECRVVTVDPITDAEVEAEYPKGPKNAVNKTPTRGSKIDPSCSDIYWSAGTWTAAKTAAAAAIQATEAALKDGGNAFCIVRPPGHHCFDVPAGFCILNNVVLAARRVIQAGKRVAILDWDYHFGDGTAAALWGEEQAMFVSLHAAMTTSGMPTYPRNTRRDFKGEGLQQNTDGRCFNVQWVHDDADDAAYAYAFRTLILPALQQFAPDVILISAGYDAIKGDALAGMEVSATAFGFMAAALARLNIPVVAVLEGGYSVDLLAFGVSNTILGLQLAPTFLKTLNEWLTLEPAAKHAEVVDAVRKFVLTTK